MRKDAQKFEFASAGLRRLIHTNASRGLTERLKQLTGVDKESLFFSDVRYNDDELGDTTRKHPFSLLSSRIQALRSRDPQYFEVEREPVSSPLASRL